MKLAPAVVVHGIAMARAAVAPGLPVTLLSAPGAACFAGAGWWRALAAAAAQDSPGTAITDILDCGDAPGRALEALRAGQKLLLLRADAAILADIAWRAGTLGGCLLPARPPALDLGAPGQARLLDEWLRQNPAR